MIRSPLASSALLLACLTACGDEVVAPAPREQPVPDPTWFAALPDPDARLAFVAEVERWFRTRDLVPSLLASGAMQVRGGKGGPQEFQLGFLAETCAEASPGEWARLVAEHLERVTAMRDALDKVEFVPWREARPQLRLRLQPASFLRESGFALDDVAAAIDIPGTVTLAFVDQTDAAVLVSRSLLDRWDQMPVFVLGMALSNTRAALASELRMEAQDIGELGKLYALTSGSYYGAAAVLWLADWPETIGEHGSIVCIPTRDAVFAWPFDDARVTKVIPALRTLATAASQSMGRTLDPGVFWRRTDGVFERIDFAEQDGKLAITPPPGLAKLIAEFEKR